MPRQVKRYKSEANLHMQVADYLRLQYPGVLFHTDFAAGIKLPMALAARNKRLQSGRGWPDLVIVHPIKGCVGLALELKKEGTTIHLKDGTISKAQHVQEQLAVLEELAHAGFVSRFVVGFGEAKYTIDKYMAGYVPLYSQITAAGKPRHPLHEDEQAF